jgi:hypothetical protein
LSRSECEATYGSASKATAQANAAAKAVAENVSSLLAGRQSMFAAVSPIAPAMVGVILLGIMMDLSKVSMDPRLSRAVIGLGTVAAFGGLALSTYLALYPRIVLNYQHKAGFLRRNLDTLLVGLIMAVLGVAFGALIK